METQYIEMWICCYSEKMDVSLSCGVEYEVEEFDINEMEEIDWIWVGLAESFWENYFEFEEGIGKAKAICITDSKKSMEEALFEVFGHFNASYTLNGEEIEWNPDVDLDEIMYSLLKN